MRRRYCTTPAWATVPPPYASLRAMSDLILIVDDEPGILSTLGGILSDEGYSTLTTSSGEEALSLYREKRPAMFLDIWLADRDGLETLEALREEDPAAAVVMMSGHGSPGAGASLFHRPSPARGGPSWSLLVQTGSCGCRATPIALSFARPTWYLRGTSAEVVPI